MVGESFAYVLSFAYEMSFTYEMLLTRSGFRVRRPLRMPEMKTTHQKSYARQVVFMVFHP